jgi:hypothetical protein
MKGVSGGAYPTEINYENAGYSQFKDKEDYEKSIGGAYPTEINYEYAVYSQFKDKEDNDRASAVQFQSLVIG